MYRQENSQIMSLYAISPVHAGSGSSMGVVDLPIQRERHTNWPHIQASGVKGAMRHHFEKFKENITGSDEQAQIGKITEKIFGTEDLDGQGSVPGAIAVSDAKILAFPMRSSKSPFVWITCPAVLKRLEMDLDLTGKKGGSELEIPQPQDEEAVVINGNMQGDILLEDYEVKITDQKFALDDSSLMKTLLKKADKLLLVSDQTFNYGVSHCTEVRTQIKIDPEKGTTVDGSLRYEEVLPSDTLMYSVLFYGTTRDDDSSIPADMLIKYMKDDVIRSHIQIGGDETLGCVLCDNYLDR